MAIWIRCDSLVAGVAGPVLIASWDRPSKRV
jgi:hypothetical protein